jgi:hypothetical protein
MASRGLGSTMLRLAWALAAALILFAAENIWVDRLVRARHRRVPSLVFMEGSTGWVVAFALMGISCAALVVSLVFVLSDRSLPVAKKGGTAAVSVLALVLFGLWFWKTGMDASAAATTADPKEHTVTLKWQASTSHVDGYNVYRSESPAGPWVKINNNGLVKGLSYVDPNVRSGAKYFYAVRSVAGPKESLDSNHTEADVPLP